MRCSRCQTENRDGRRYCRSCGLMLRILCESCGFDNLPGDHFCGGCGVALLSDPEKVGLTPLGSDDDLDPSLPPMISEANRLVMLRAELPPAPRETLEDFRELDLTDLTELDEGFVQSES